MDLMLLLSLIAVIIVAVLSLIFVSKWAKKREFKKVFGVWPGFLCTEVYVEKVFEKAMNDLFDFLREQDKPLIDTLLERGWIGFAEDYLAHELGDKILAAQNIVWLASQFGFLNVIQKSILYGRLFSPNYHKEKEEVKI